jgi:hypothetical protein
MLTEQDDRRHPHEPDPRWRESLYWSFMVREAGLGGIVYLRIDPNAGKVNPLLLVYRGRNEVAYVFTGEAPLEPRSDLDGLTACGFRLRIEQPLRKCSVSFDDGAGTSLDFAFSATHSAFDYARNRAGCFPLLATNRFEQAGRVEGHLRLKGREMTLSSFGHRDHSWGIRDWDAIQHYKWISAQVGDSIAVNLLYFLVRGEVLFNGYVYDGDELRGIVGAEITTAYESDNVTQRSVSAAIDDETGKKTIVEGRVFATTELAMENSLLVEGAADLAINGTPGTGIVEYVWPASYAEHLKRSGWPAEG